MLGLTSVRGARPPSCITITTTTNDTSCRVFGFVVDFLRLGLLHSNSGNTSIIRVISTIINSSRSVTQQPSPESTDDTEDAADTMV